MRLGTVLRALSSRNLRLYFFGQGLSLIGMWITNVASGWLVYRLTNSEFLLGLVAFSGQIPTGLLGPFAGVWVDRFPRQRILQFTQTLSMLQSFALAALAYSGHISVTNLIVLNLFQGCVNALDTPARQSFLSELVANKRDLPNAIALNASLFHGSRLIGPAIAGLLIAFRGEAVCFLVDGISYGAVLLSLYLISNTTQTAVERHPSWRAALVAGLQYSLASIPIRTIISVTALMALLGTPQLTLLPVFARDIFSEGPELLGYLTSISGLGAFCGALFLASRGRESNLGKVIAPMPFLISLGQLGLATAPNKYLAGAALLISGFSMVVFFAGLNSSIQMAVEDRKRARVMSLFNTGFFSMLPIGGLLAGLEASFLGAQATVALGGLASIVIGVYWLARIKLIHSVSSAG